jgi:hypothetical protein
MFVLPVAAFGRYQIPSVLFYHLDNVPHLHARGATPLTLPDSLYFTGTPFGIRLEATHPTGRAVAKSCHRNLAELYDERLLNSGPLRHHRTGKLVEPTAPQ